VRIPLATVTLSVLVSGLVFLTSVRLYAVEGESMAPALHPGQVVLVTSLPFLWNPLRPGDIVVAESPVGGGRLLVKRVVARDAEGMVVLMGDNSDRSIDSRHFGSIPAAGVLGKVVLVGARNHR
jgi:nickel-type superoxide dismutase maturation protease